MIEQLIDKMLGLTPKRRFREYRERVNELPEDYQEAAKAVEKYSFTSGLTNGDAVLAMLDDLTDLFEQAAADGTPIRDIVGDDPADFVETFVQNYKGRTWKTRKKERLASAINRAVAEQTRAASRGEPAAAGASREPAAAGASREPAEDEHAGSRAAEEDENESSGGTERQRWRQYRTRVKRLPGSYRKAIEAVQRYSYYSGLHSGPESGTGMQAMLDDLADLFEQAAAAGTPIRDIVGDDPVEFADTFFRNYKGGEGTAADFADGDQ